MLHENEMSVCYWLLRNISQTEAPIPVTDSDTLTALYIGEERSRREGGRGGREGRQGGGGDSSVRGKIGQRERESK